MTMRKAGISVYKAWECNVGSHKHIIPMFPRKRKCKNLPEYMELPAKFSEWRWQTQHYIAIGLQYLLAYPVTSHILPLHKNLEH